MAKINNEILFKRIDHLSSLASEVVSSIQKKNLRNNYVIENTDKTLFIKYKSATLSFLDKLFSPHEPYYREVTGIYQSHAQDRAAIQAIEAIFSNIRHDIENGWLIDLKNTLSEQIFTDYLEMADYLLEETLKDPAAVIIGSTLEEHLRTLCLKNGLDITFTNPHNGNVKPKKADTMNSDLKAASVYNGIDHKNVLVWLAIRNDAAHGHYINFTLEQVRIMYDGVLSFIGRTI